MSVLSDFLRGVQQLAADPDLPAGYDQSWQVASCGPHPSLDDRVVVVLSHESGRSDEIVLDPAMGDPEPDDYAEWWDMSSDARELVQWLRICRHTSVLELMHEDGVALADAVPRLRESGYYDWLRREGRRVDSVDGAA